jgi:hypothetical protein
MPIRRSLFVIICLLGLMLPAVLLSFHPNSPPTPPPSAADAVAAKSVFDRLRSNNSSSAAQDIRLSWEELSSIVKMGGRAAKIDNSLSTRDGERLKLSGSKALPLGFWANIVLWVAPNASGTPVITGQFGRVHVPAIVMNAAEKLGRLILRQRGIELPPSVKIVQKLSLSDDGIAAQIVLPRNSKLILALSALRPEQIDRELVRQRYCAMTKVQREKPTTDFTTALRRSFSGAFRGRQDNRARLVALAMMTVSSKVGKSVAVDEAAIASCRIPVADFLLLERPDLPKHWALSAALSAIYGADVSDVMGTWKEMADSAPNGSGFSYVDLAADRSGSMAGSRLSDENSTDAIQLWLAHVSDERLLPISSLALSEGLSEAEFKARFTSVESPEFAAIVARIDRTLARGMRPNATSQ